MYCSASLYAFLDLGTLFILEKEITYLFHCQAQVEGNILIMGIYGPTLIEAINYA